MATIHLMVGFIGFGKTTIAKELEKRLSAVRFTHDQIMVEKYGRNPDDFNTKYKIVDDFIKTAAKECIGQNRDVIMDYGLWTHQKRNDYYQWAKTLTDHIVFHVVNCDLQTAKRRVSERTQNDKTALIIDEKTFDSFSSQFEPWDDTDNYPVIFYHAPTTRYIGETVYVKMDRPKGTKHPKFGFEYPVNYGFLPYTQSGDGEELDAYVLGIDKPLEEYIGRCIGVIHRLNDDDDKLIVVPESLDLRDEDIEAEVAFQEKWFQHTLIRDKHITKTHFGIYASIIKDNQILLIQKARGPYTGLYDLPGGSQEKDETYSQTLTREVKEETGLDVITAENKRFYRVIFSDFTAASGETGTLQHDAVLYDTTVDGCLLTTPDGRDSSGAVWVDIETLNAQNATPYALIAAKKPLIAVADKNDNIISTHLRGTPFKKNRYPMIAAVFLFNSRGNIILQKIAAHKRWGGLWSYSAAGHVDAGEDYITAAKRELFEEMGIDAKIEREIAAFSIIRNGITVAFHHVFLVHSDAKITPDPSEVAEIREISLTDLKDEIKHHPEQFLDAFVTAVKKWQDKK